MKQLIYIATLILMAATAQAQQISVINIEQCGTPGGGGGGEADGNDYHTEMTISGDTLYLRSSLNAPDLFAELPNMRDSCGATVLDTFSNSTHYAITSSNDCGQDTAWIPIVSDGGGGPDSVVTTTLIDVTGSTTKTFTLIQSNGDTLTTDWIDLTGGGGGGSVDFDSIVDLTFNRTTNVLSIENMDGIVFSDTIPDDLDSLTDATFVDGTLTLYNEAGDTIQVQIPDADTNTLYAVENGLSFKTGVDTMIHLGGILIKNTVVTTDDYDMDFEEVNADGDSVYLSVRQANAEGMEAAMMRADANDFTPSSVEVGVNSQAEWYGQVNSDDGTRSGSWEFDEFEFYTQIERSGNRRHTQSFSQGKLDGRVTNLTDLSLYTDYVFGEADGISLINSSGTNQVTTVSLNDGNLQLRSEDDILVETKEYIAGNTNQFDVLARRNVSDAEVEYFPLDNLLDSIGYSDSIVTVTNIDVTGSTTKTLTLTQSNGQVLTTDWMDLTEGASSGTDFDSIVSMTFNLNNRVLTIENMDGITFTDTIPDTNTLYAVENGLSFKSGVDTMIHLGGILIKNTVVTTDDYDMDFEEVNADNDSVYLSVRQSNAEGMEAAMMRADANDFTPSSVEVGVNSQAEWYGQVNSDDGTRSGSWEFDEFEFYTQIERAGNRRHTQSFSQGKLDGRVTNLTDLSLYTDYVFGEADGISLINSSGTNRVTTVSLNDGNLQLRSEDDILVETKEYIAGNTAQYEILGRVNASDAEVDYMSLEFLLDTLDIHPRVNNGLNHDGTFTQLGGPLVENTVIDVGIHEMHFSKANGADSLVVAWENSVDGKRTLSLKSNDGFSRQEIRLNEMAQYRRIAENGAAFSNSYRDYQLQRDSIADGGFNESFRNMEASIQTYRVQDPNNSTTRFGQIAITPAAVTFDSENVGGAVSLQLSNGDFDLNVDSEFLIEAPDGYYFTNDFYPGQNDTVQMLLGYNQTTGEWTSVDQSTIGDDTNFAEDDLTVTGFRTHDFNSNSMLFDNVNYLEIRDPASNGYTKMHGNEFEFFQSGGADVFMGQDIKLHNWEDVGIEIEGTNPSSSVTVVTPDVAGNSYTTGALLQLLEDGSSNYYNEYTLYDFPQTDAPAGDYTIQWTNGNPSWQPWPTPDGNDNDFVNSFNVTGSAGQATRTVTAVIPNQPDPPFTLNIEDADADATNEYQDPTWNAGTRVLSLTNSGVDVTITDSDGQTLSYDGETGTDDLISISNGNQITIDDDVTTAENGLNNPTATTTRLGGGLLENTTITANTYDFTVFDQNADVDQVRLGFKHNNIYGDEAAYFRSQSNDLSENIAEVGADSRGRVYGRFEGTGTSNSDRLSYFNQDEYEFLYHVDRTGNREHRLVMRYNELDGYISNDSDPINLRTNYKFSEALGITLENRSGVDQYTYFALDDGDVEIDSDRDIFITLEQGSVNVLEARDETVGNEDRITLGDNTAVTTINAHHKRLQTDNSVQLDLDVEIYHYTGGTGARELPPLDQWYNTDAWESETRTLIIKNAGSGILTINPPTANPGAEINGASSITLAGNNAVTIYTDGTDFWTY